MSNAVELVMSSSSAVPVERMCLGREYATRIGALDVTVLMPRYSRPTLDDDPSLIAPNFTQLSSDMDWGSYFRYSDHLWMHSPWGQVHRWWINDDAQSSQSIHVFGLRFMADDDGVEKMDLLAEHFERWWRGVETWVEVLSEYVVSLPDRDNNIELRGGWTRNIDGSLRRVNGNRGKALSASAKPDGGLTDRILARVFRLASGSEPPIEWRLIRQSRLNRAREAWRAAVLDAGTAAELALGRLIDAQLGGVRPEVRRALVTKYRTLGQQGTLYRTLGGRLSPTFHAKLVEIRNAATHDGALLSRGEAIGAEKESKRIVEKALPSAALS